MTTEATTHRFEAEVQELLGLMIHSLYTQKDVFLRELISNASDACDKLRLAALTDASLRGEGEEPRIDIEIDRDARTLSVVDNGIGMSREEMAANLGTLARSGTRAFLEDLKQREGAAAEALIGQFGVGFYSAFMVADEVVVTSRRAGSGEGARWASKADGTYTLEDAEVPRHGTRVTLHVPERAEAEDGEEPDWLDPAVIRRTVKRHSDFVEHPIRLGDEVLNSRKPLWARPAKEISAQEHAEFYRHLAHDFHDPAKVVHVRAEVPVEFTALLYVPAARRPEFLERPEATSRIALYVRRVLIMPDCADLLPPWLRFVRGVVECPDLPLNVSRQALQANPITRRIRRHLEGKVLGALGELLAEDRATYEAFFQAEGRVLKEGIAHGADDDNRLSKLCLFPSSSGEGLTTLEAYVERMPAEQEAVWVLAGMDLPTARTSPLLEAFRAKGQEVLLLCDPVDEWMLPRLTTFGGRKLEAIDRGEVGLEGEEARREREAKEASHKDLLAAVRVALQDDVAAVRFSSRLKDSPAVLVRPEGAASASLERLLREVGGADVPTSKPILELNPDHPLVARMEVLRGSEPQRLAEYARLLFGQALLLEGSPLPDAAGFARLLTALMVGEPT
jgi:molecular chaperone HtpG